MPPETQKNFILNYWRLIVQSYHCLINVVLRRAWIDEATFRKHQDKYIETNGKTYIEKLLKQELKSIQECSDIQRFIISTILFNK